MLPPIPRNQRLNLPYNLIRMGLRQRIRAPDIARLDGRDQILMLLDILTGKLIVEGLVIHPQQRRPSSNKRKQSDS